MAADSPQPLLISDARSTYRYLRAGLVLAVVLLATSILIEHGNAPRGCWQTSISAYYYTPVRAIFVGGLIAIGFGLIVIKGRSTIEDVFLNVAGMLAFVVAVAPTVDGDICLRFGETKTRAQVAAAKTVLPSVEAAVHNNVKALLIVGFLGLALALVLAAAVNGGLRKPLTALRRGTRISLAITTVVLLLGWWALERWDHFYTKAHGIAAVAMFVALVGAVACKALEKTRPGLYFWIYASVAALMAAGGIAIKVLELGGDHNIFVLEAWEITLFAVFWIVQTRDYWDEQVTTSPGGTAETPWPWELRR